MLLTRAFQPVLVLLVVLPATALSASAPATPTCDGFALDPTFGPSCRADGGWLVQMPDGAVVFTHGPDPIPAGPTLAADLPDPGVACVDAGEPHIRTLYATPRDVALATATAAPARKALVLESVLGANAIVHKAATQHGAEIRWKMLCDANGLPLIEDVRLNLRATEINFWRMADELMARGYGGADEKVLVFYDGTWTGCGGCGGWSYIPGGDAASPTNANNYGWWSYSAIFMANFVGYVTDEVVLHEMTHGMGGVQLSAPHSSGGWHCNDGWDIMCYADGGSSSAYANTCQPIGHSYVGLSQPYDCGSDDYFHPSPAPGSYLDTHWNVGASYNRFLARG